MISTILVNKSKSGDTVSKIEEILRVERKTFVLLLIEQRYCLGHPVDICLYIFISIQFKGDLQCENKLISYERAFKMLENDIYIVGIGHGVLELLSFKVEPGNHQRGISLLQKLSEIFVNIRLVSPKMTSHLTSHNFQILKIEIFSKPCKI